jgi:hypothetical protein
MHLSLPILLMFEQQPMTWVILTFRRTVRIHCAPRALDTLSFLHNGLVQWAHTMGTLLELENCRLERTNVRRESGGAYWRARELSVRSVRYHQHHNMPPSILNSLINDCLVHILSFLSYETMNIVAVCSKPCKEARSNECLDQTRTGTIALSKTATCRSLHLRNPC